MSTRKVGPFPLRRAFGFVLTLVLLPSGAILLREYAPGNMWLGYLVGGVLTVAVLGFALWRAARSPQTATTVERVVSNRADERDIAVRDTALAGLGVASIPLTSAAGVAVALGVPAGPALAVLLWTLFGFLAVAYVRANRSM
jgi:hypothetical protein